MIRKLVLCLLSSLVLVASLAAADSRAIADAAFDEFIRQDFANLAKRFSPEMSAALPLEKLAGVSPILKQLGALRTGRPAPQVMSVQGMNVYVFTCDFSMTRMNIVIAVNPAGQIAGLQITPTPAEAPKPGELVVVTGSIKLPATLALPTGASPFPIVVLVHGSGPNDRDETVGANAPFKDLAEGLAARGVATLRYVKRTKQYPQNPVATVKEEVIDDALSALALARQQPGVDPQRVFLLGHSMGAYLAPRIAQGGPAPAGIVLLAGSVRPILDLAREQLQYLGAPLSMLDTLRASAPASYWDDLAGYDPVALARNVQAPFLILQGERDYQVTMKEFELWKEGLKARQDVTLKSYPKLNHLFLEGEGKSLPAEYSTPGHIPAYVLDDIAAFVKKPAGK
jgi:dienelactone hydrolase